MPVIQPTQEQWREILAPNDRWNARLFHSLIAVFGTPPSVIDFGCGTGALARTAAVIGADAVGVDLIAPQLETRFESGGKLQLLPRNLEQPFDMGRKFAWAFCLEVVEHIEGRYAGVIANTISRHLMDGGWLFFSAAPPGQKGDGHIHLKPADYWRTLLDNRNLHWEEALTVKTRLMWDLIPMPMMWLTANLQVFIKRVPQVGELVHPDGDEE